MCTAIGDTADNAVLYLEIVTKPHFFRVKRTSFFAILK